MNLQTKMLYSSTLRELIDIKKECGMIADTTINLKDAVDTMPLLVPVVGEFSAGKSTMLNNLIGKDILSVSMKPETAIPAELYYSADEYDEGVYTDGRAKRITDVAQAAGKYACVRRYINSSFLKTIEPIVLVDMPGFDSPVNEHSTAIFSYLDRGIHYAVLIPADGGTISRSMQRQVENILDFKKMCTFFVSKTDTRSPEEVTQVKAELQSALSVLMGGTVAVQEVNKDEVTFFNNFVNTLQPDELFKQQFHETLLNECYDARNTLNTRIAALKSDKEKNARAIRELEESIAKIEAKKQNMMERAQNDAFADEADSIASAVGSAINSNMDSLVSIAQSSGSSAVQEEISSIIKSTVISQVQSVMGRVASRFGRDLAGEIKDMGTLFAQYNAPDTIIRLQQSAETLFDSVKTSVEGYIAGRQNQGKGGGAGKNIGGVATTVSTIAGIAGIATNIVAPIIGVVLMILPQIFGLLFGGNRQQEQQSQIRQAIAGQIPAIKRQVRTKAIELLKENSGGIITTISEKFDTELKNKKQEIENAQKANEAHAAKNEAEMEKLRSYVSNIETLLEKLLG